MTEFERVTFYLCGALLCYVMIPAITRAENIWKGKPFEKDEGFLSKDFSIKIGASMIWPIMLPIAFILWLYLAINILIWTSLEHKEHIKRQEANKKLFETIEEDSKRMVNELLKKEEPSEK